MAKLERYIGQLVDDRGGVDDSVFESIVKDVERSSRVKGALKKVGGKRTYCCRFSSPFFTPPLKCGRCVLYVHHVCMSLR